MGYTVYNHSTVERIEWLPRLIVLGVLTVGVVALAPGAYGVWGLSVVIGDWLACQDGRLSLVAAVGTSYPAGYCQATDWGRSFGIGVTLVGTGLAGLIAIFAALRHPTWRARG